MATATRRIGLPITEIVGNAKETPGGTAGEQNVSSAILDTLNLEVPVRHLSEMSGYHDTWSSEEGSRLERERDIWEPLTYGWYIKPQDWTRSPRGKVWVRKRSPRGTSTICREMKRHR